MYEGLCFGFVAGLFFMKMVMKSTYHLVFKKKDKAADLILSQQIEILNKKEE